MLSLLQILTQRINDVFKRLPQMHDAGGDVENVHKLRVATRRTVEALRAFKKALGGKLTRDLRHKLKRLRLAADQARDADVFIERLEKSPDEPGHATLMRLARGHRDEAQPDLLGIQEQAQAEGWKNQFKAALGNLRARKDEKGQPKFKSAARTYLKKSLKQFVKASHGNLEDDAELHQVRIRTKRLRYAIEIGKNAFPPTLGGPIYTQIEGWQDRLGDINDRAVALNLLSEWSVRTVDQNEREVLLTRIRLERAEHQQLRSEFLKDVTDRTIKTLKKRMKRIWA